MKYKRFGFIFSILMLVLLSACQMGTATPTASVTCKQTGCPYPAVCDQNTGICTIYQTPQAPLTKANNPGLAGGAIAANNPNAVSIIPPACVPSVPSIGQVYAFCANQTAKIGGASFVSGWAMTSETGATCQNTSTNTTCTGTPGNTMQVMVCTDCVITNDLHLPISDYACPSGSVAMWDGINYGCVTGSSPYPKEPSTFPPACPSGDHYDNSKQNCVDNGTGNLVPDTVSKGCPAGFPYYDLFYNVCVKKPLNLFDCQYFPVPIGDCGPIKKVPGVMPSCTPNPLTGKCP